MDKLKRRILEEASVGEEVIEDFEKHDTALEAAGIIEEAVDNILSIMERILAFRKRFVIFVHSNEPWRSRRRIKKSLKRDLGAEAHTKTCRKCQFMIKLLQRS